MKTPHRQFAQKAPASALAQEPASPCPGRRHLGPVRRRFGGLYAPELLEARIAPATFTVTNLLGDRTEGSLRKEIEDANAAPGADTIVFKLTDPLVPHTITLRFAFGEIPINGPLTIKGPGIDLLTVSGDHKMRIFNIDDGAAGVLSPTTISGLTLTDGKAVAGLDNGGAIFSLEPLALKNVVIRGSEAAVDGGGVFVNTAGKVSIVGSRIVHNVAKADGGGLYLAAAAGISVVKTTIADNTALTRGGLYAVVSDPKSVILIDTCIISSNTATNGRGGGLQLDGPDDGKIIVKNSLISGNSATTSGGGIYLDDGNLLITKTTFSNNTASRGGALGSDVAKSLTISGSRFIGNRASGGADAGGGALYLEGATVVKITGTLFSRNTSGTGGGAIAHNGALTMAITGSSFLDNTGSAGGAIILSDAAVLTMRSSTFSGNTGGSGGAIHAGTGAVLNLTGNKFTENRATNGGAIGIFGLVGAAAKANLSGNLFQANVAEGSGGAVAAFDDSVFTSKGDKFIGNVALTGQGGGVYLDNKGGIFITGSLFQSNVAGNNSGGGLLIGESATLTGLKVLDNISGPGGRGGGLRVGGAGITVVITKSLITGNVASDGGGIFFDSGTTTIATTIVKGNAAGINQNIGSA